MSRDCYETVVVLPDATGTLKALANVKVSVVPRGASDVPGSLVNIYASDTGATRGPDLNTGATGTNPITTGPSGAVRFWADAPFEYDIVFEDNIAPARINDRVGWNAQPSKAGSLPTTFLAPDAGITQAMLSPNVVKQEVPIGGVIEWWRPANTVPVPDGYEICDGHQVLAANHEFPGIAGNINVPDLRNVFILGADVGKADGSTVVNVDNSDLVASSPGIRGAAGSNKHVLQQTELAAHKHNTTDDGSHNHGGGTGAYDSNHLHGFADGMSRKVPSYLWDESVWVVSLGSGWAAAISNRAGGVQYESRTSAADRDMNHAHTIGFDGVHHHTTTDTGGNAAHNNMPKWVGLLRIMKVRRT